MFRGGAMKLLLILLAISLLMALTGFGARQLVVLTMIQRGKSEDEGERFVEVQKEIKGSSRVQLYENALRALRENKIPENADYTTAFSREFKINYIARDVNTVVVDFSSRNLAGSQQQERLLIGQIVKTLAQSFDEVESVAFTVDGEAADTLMGHVDIRSPFTLASVHLI